MHCLAAEPLETLLRISVQDDVKVTKHSAEAEHHYERDIAYEALVLEALRPGYRCLPLRSNRSGTPIDMCCLLVHVTIMQVPLPPDGSAQDLAA